MAWARVVAAGLERDEDVDDGVVLRGGGERRSAHHVSSNQFQQYHQSQGYFIFIVSAESTEWSSGSQLFSRFKDPDHMFLGHVDRQNQSHFIFISQRVIAAGLRR
jgi:hypothetical protein